MVAAGFIDESTLRCVRLRDVDDNVHVVPNDMITSVVDMSCDFAQSVVDGGVAYLEHVDETLVTMREVGTTPRATPAFGHRILEEVEVVGAECRDGTAVSLPCRFQAVPKQKRAVRLVQLRQLEQAFDESFIEITHTHVTVDAEAAEDGSAPTFRPRSVAAGT